MGASVLPRRGSRADDRVVPRGARSGRVTVPPCRSCGSLAVETVLSLGETPLANSLVAPDHLDEPEPKYPLDLAFCRSCSLVQITETVPPEVLFRDYVYFSSYSDTMLRHAAALAD